MCPGSGETWGLNTKLEEGLDRRLFVTKYGRWAQIEQVLNFFGGKDKVEGISIVEFASFVQFKTRELALEAIFNKDRRPFLEGPEIKVRPYAPRGSYKKSKSDIYDRHVSKSITNLEPMSGQRAKQQHDAGWSLPVGSRFEDPTTSVYSRPSSRRRSSPSRYESGKRTPAKYSSSSSSLKSPREHGSRKRSPSRHDHRKRSPPRSSEKRQKELSSSSSTSSSSLHRHRSESRTRSSRSDSLHSSHLASPYRERSSADKINGSMSTRGENGASASVEKVVRPKAAEHPSRRQPETVQATQTGSGMNELEKLTPDEVLITEQIQSDVEVVDLRESSSPPPPPPPVDRVDTKTSSKPKAESHHASDTTKTPLFKPEVLGGPVWAGLKPAKWYISPTKPENGVINDERRFKTSDHSEINLAVVGRDNDSRRRSSRSSRSRSRSRSHSRRRDRSRSDDDDQGRARTRDRDRERERSRDRDRDRRRDHDGPRGQLVYPQHVPAGVPPHGGYNLQPVIQFAPGSMMGPQQPAYGHMNGAQYVNGNAYMNGVPVAMPMHMTMNSIQHSGPSYPPGEFVNYVKPTLALDMPIDVEQTLKLMLLQRSAKRFSVSQIDDIIHYLETTRKNIIEQALGGVHHRRSDSVETSAPVGGGGGQAAAGYSHAQYEPGRDFVSPDGQVPDKIADDSELMKNLMHAQQLFREANDLSS